MHTAPLNPAATGADPAPPGPEVRQLHLRLANDPAELAPLAETVDALAEELGWDAASAMHINLVLEELAINIISYGYPDGRAGQFDLWLEATPAEVRLRLEDDGDPFDPFAVAPPDLSLELDDRPIGGLGIHFVRNFMDAYAYRREAGRNCVTLAKRLG